MSGMADLERLLKSYALAAAREDIYIQKLLKDAVEQLRSCEADEYYYADGIARNLCCVIEIMEKRHEKELERARARHCSNGQLTHSWVAQLPVERDHAVRFQNGSDMLRAFYNHYKKPEQDDYFELYGLERQLKELPPAESAHMRKRINPTLKDYAARISTFAKRYLVEMVDPRQLEYMDPLLFTYENIEWILAAFKTRDNDGSIVKQRVNIRSALRKLNEFKRTLETKSQY